MALRESFSAPDQSCKRMRVRARFEKTLGSVREWVRMLCTSQQQNDARGSDKSSASVYNCSASLNFPALKCSLPMSRNEVMIAVCQAYDDLRESEPAPDGGTVTKTCTLKQHIACDQARGPGKRSRGKSWKVMDAERCACHLARRCFNCRCHPGHSRHGDRRHWSQSQKNTKVRMLFEDAYFVIMLKPTSLLRKVALPTSYAQRYVDFNPPKP